MSNPGSLWYTARRPDGTWHGGFGRAGSEEANGPGQFTALGCGAVGTELHVVAVAKFTEVWHTTRDAGGSWEPSFAFVGSDFQEGFPAIDCATVFPELHVVVVHGISGGGLWHTVRHADGSWQPGFAVVGGLFRRVACAGVAVDVERVGTATTEVVGRGERPAVGQGRERAAVLVATQVSDGCTPPKWARLITTPREPASAS